MTVLDDDQLRRDHLMLRRLLFEERHGRRPDVLEVMSISTLGDWMWSPEEV